MFFIQTREEIAKQLGFKADAKVYLQSFNRPNLRLEVRLKTTKSDADIVSVLKQKFHNQSGIIYCLSKKDCDSLSKELISADINAKAYHSSIAADVRKSTQLDWISGEIKVIVATTAFGMGIDKANVRFVIHHSMSKSIEGYYQEVGRAGRDGKLAFCILYYSSVDFGRWKNMFGSDQAQLTALNDINNFCMNKADCRRLQILSHFGEPYDPIDCYTDLDTACDNCFQPDIDEALTTLDDIREISEIINFTPTDKFILQYICQIIGPAASRPMKNLTQTQLVTTLLSKLLCKIIICAFLNQTHLVIIS
mgnify:CR=1 FL=1